MGKKKEKENENDGRIFEGNFNECLELHTVKDKEGKEWICLYPFYWLYNAGLVGIIRSIESIENIKEKEKENDKTYENVYEIFNRLKSSGKLYDFGNYGELRIRKELWDCNIIFKIYVRMMTKVFENEFDMSSFWWDIFGKSSILSNKVNLGRLNIYKKMSNNDELKIQCKKKSLGVLYEIMSMHKEPNKFFKKPNKNSKSTSEKLIECLDKNNNKEEIKKVLQKISYKEENVNDDRIEKWIEELKKLTQKDMYEFKKEIIKKANEEILKHLKNIQNNKERNLRCAMCGKKIEKIKSHFNIKNFFFEGGSNKSFPNFYWGSNIGMPLCYVCDTVLLFFPIAVFPDGDLSHGEFINIPDARLLWLLNKYRIEVMGKRKESDKDIKSRLINAITSTGALLSLKGKWMLQNVEFIEVGGIRDQTVHTLEFHPVALDLLTGPRNYKIQGWLTKVENILYRVKNKDIVKGRKIIQYFLDGKVGMIIKDAFLLTKEKTKGEKDNAEKEKKERKLMWDEIKSVALLAKSLLMGEPASEKEFYNLGETLYGMLEGDGEEKDKETQMLITRLFPKIVGVKREEFVQEVVRVYMSLGKEVPERILDLLGHDNKKHNREDLKFRVDALLFVIGLASKAIKDKKEGG